MSSTTISPPVQDSRRGELMMRLFGALQNARFNQLYYQSRAKWFHDLATCSNMIAAVAASAVLTGLLADGALLGAGPLVLKALTLVAAISAAIGPILHLDAKASQMEKAALGHSIMMDRLRRLLSDLKFSELDDSHLARDKEIESFGSALASLDEAPSEKTRELCWKRALEEFPSEKAWTVV